MKRLTSLLLLYSGFLATLAWAAEDKLTQSEFLQGLVSLNGREMSVTVEEATPPVPDGSRKAIFQATDANHFKIVTQFRQPDGTFNAVEFEEYEIQPDKHNPLFAEGCEVKVTRGNVKTNRTTTLLGNGRFTAPTKPGRAPEFSMVFFKPDEFYPSATRGLGSPVVLIFWENNQAQFNCYTEPTKSPVRTYRSIKHKSAP